MDVPSKSERIIQVKVLRQITLQRALPEMAKKASLVMDIEPGPYTFRRITFDDGRREPEWVLLVGDEDFGLPLKNLRVLDLVTESVEASDAYGDPYFEPS